MGAAGYGLMRGVHIRADFLYRNWSNKTQATVDATLYMAFLIAFILFFRIIAAQYWEVAYRTSETAFDSPWELFLWPARSAMPVSGFLLVLQSFLELFRVFQKKGKEREYYFILAMPAHLILLIWLSSQYYIQMPHRVVNGLATSFPHVQICQNLPLVLSCWGRRSL